MDDAVLALANDITQGGGPEEGNERGTPQRQDKNAAPRKVG
jgi:hypothetical protein